MAEYFTLSDLQKPSKDTFTLSEVGGNEYDPTEGMSRSDLFLAGVGKAMVDTGRGVGQVLGLVSRDDVAESRKRDEALMNKGWAKAGNITGNAAIAAPLALVPGAATLRGATLIGAGQGFLQPSTSTSETLLNTGIGGVASAVVPAAITGYKTAKSFIEPFYQSGRDKIIGRALNDATGGQGRQVLNALEGYQSPIQGVLPTAAEAAQNPGLSALQRTATASDPVAMNAITARMAQNNDARIEALRAIAGDVNQAVEARKQATEALYAAANGQTITLTPALEALMKRPIMQSAVGDARTLAANEGRQFSLRPSTPPQPSAILDASGNSIFTTPGRPGSMLGQDAHTIKRSIDDVIEGLAGQGGLAKNSRRAAGDTQSNFLSEIEKQIPEYGQARQTFAQMSRPVNQAQAVDLMVERATNNIQGNMTPAAFNRAVSDRTVQSATGRKGVTLNDVFDPPQLQRFGDIRDSLIRLDKANNEGRGVGSDTVQKLAFNNMLNQAGIPQAIRNSSLAGIPGNLLQRAGQIAYTDANDQMRSQLAQALLDPKEAARLLRGGLLNPKLEKLLENVKKGGAVATPSLSLGLLSDVGQE